MSNTYRFELEFTTDAPLSDRTLDKMSDRLEAQIDHKVVSARLAHADVVITPKEVLEAPHASYWLKDALKSALQRDCVDALRDAEILVSVLRVALPAEMR